MLALSLHNRIFPLFVDVFLERREENIAKIKEAFRYMDTLLIGNSDNNRFLLDSAEPQMCDVVIFPPVHRLMMLEHTELRKKYFDNYGLEDSPHFVAWYESMKEHELVKPVIAEVAPFRNQINKDVLKHPDKKAVLSLPYDYS